MEAPFRLVVERGANAGQTFTVAGSGGTIGRHEDNTIVLADARLSRRHARLAIEGGALVVTDLGSANGTRVNGQPVTGSRALRPGDRIELGATTLRVEGPGVPVAGGVGDATVPASPPPPPPRRRRRGRAPTTRPG